jgi:5-methylcytosine-specific restriction endonuclease McrA
MARGRGASAEKRSEALALGQPTYLGKPCVHGHDGTRYSSCRMCVGCVSARRGNRVSNTAYWKKWDKANPEKRYASVRAWKAKNPERAKELSFIGWQARRSRKASAIGSFTLEQVEALFVAQGGCCAYCQATENFSLDHKTPLSRGGSNSVENLQWLCVSCNSRKRTRTDEEYRLIAGITSPRQDAS